MNGSRKILIIVIALAALLMGSCAPAAPQAASEPALPSATPLPPTDTPPPPTPTSPPPTETPPPPTETPVTPTQPQESPTPAPTLEGVSGKVEVNGQQMYYECYGEGEPTVVIEVGYGAEIKEWYRVMQMIAPDTRVCSYDRPGSGQSDPPAAKFTSLDMANALHQLLGSAGIPGPYILAGHSAGAFNVVLFGSQYPDEVAGIVLIDPSNPGAYKILLDRLPAGQAGNLKQCRKHAEGMDKMWNDPDHASYGAWWILAESSKQLRAITSLGDLPLVVITAGNPYYECLGEYGEMERQIWRELHAQYAGLSTNGVQITAEGSSHQVHQGAPQLVVDTILQLVEQARGEE